MSKIPAEKPEVKEAIHAVAALARRQAHLERELADTRRRFEDACKALEELLG